MLKRDACHAACLLVGMIVIASLAPVLAQDDVTDGKSYRIILTNGKEIVGEVTDEGAVYKVTQGVGINRWIKKSQVRELIPIEAEESAAVDSSLRGHITDAEIEEILGSESVEDLYVWDYIDQVDLMEPLKLDEESLREMLMFAGREANKLVTPHFVVVYTSDIQSAQRLAARLETIYRWNVTFMKLYGIPPKRPDHKFEVFHFGTYDEFVGYATLCGHMAQGAAGFYMETNNRCAFFDQRTYPVVANILKAAEDKNTPFQERRKLQNEIERWANFYDLAVVQHEATHAIHFNIGVFPKRAGLGSWIVEGLCVQFEVPPTQEGGSFGAINYSRLDSYRKAYGPNGEAVTLDFVKRLIMAPGSGIHDYVLGWALNYYLRKEHKEQYAKWMQYVSGLEENSQAGADATALFSVFERIFGHVDEEWVEEFRDYIAAIPMKRSAIVEFPANTP